MPFLELELSAVIDMLEEAAAARPEMAATGLGPPRRGGLEPDDLGDAGGPSLPDDLDADAFSRDRAGDEELAAPGLGLSVTRRKIDVFDLDLERWRRESGQEAPDLLHRKADDVVIVAVHPGDEHVADLLDGVSAGLVEEGALIKIAVDHLVGELAERDIGQIIAGEESVLRFGVKGEARDDTVPPARERLQHGPGALQVGRLAQDAEPEGDDRCRPR